MTKESLISYLNELNELWMDLRNAEVYPDGRSRTKKKRDARSAIWEFAHNIPEEIRLYLDNRIGVNALLGHHAEGDIGECVKALRAWIDSMPE